VRGQAVCGCDEVLHGHFRIVEAGGTDIGLIRVHGRIVAFENVCPHQGGPVCQGELLGRLEVLLDAQKRIAEERFSESDITLICPWHGWTYDVATGECITDRKIRLRRREVEESDGVVYLQERAATVNGGSQTPS
jgi:nitrite reductase (NADH) small subunit